MTKVCASNGRTYNSSCHVMMHNCLYNDNIVISHKGKCISKDGLYFHTILLMFIISFDSIPVQDCIGCHPYSRCDYGPDGRKQCVCPQVCVR